MTGSTVGNCFKHFLLSQKKSLFPRQECALIPMENLCQGLSSRFSMVLAEEIVQLPSSRDLPPACQFLPISSQDHPFKMTKETCMVSWGQFSSLLKSQRKRNRNSKMPVMVLVERTNGLTHSDKVQCLPLESRNPRTPGFQAQKGMARQAQDKSIE